MRRRTRSQKIDHDRLFKELLRAFFIEFLEAFLPTVAQYIEPGSLEFLDKELFTDINSRTKHVVDLVVKAKFKGEEAFFLIHVENQSATDEDIARRMFQYFARLHQQYKLPVYPILICSFDAPTRPEPNHYRVSFPDMNVLQFNYRVIQLNRLPWRRFVKQPNPAATALMTRMKMTASERPKVKLECLRLLATLKLDPARTQVIGAFLDTYLKLTAEEFRRYEQAFNELAPEERTSAMEIMSSWGLEGLEKGLQQGKESLILRLLNRRLGAIPAGTPEKLDNLSADDLDNLGEALLDFETYADFDKWYAGLSSN